MPDADRFAINAASAGAPNAALSGLLAALRANGGLPSTGHTLARLTALLENDSDAIHSLADAILADVALTQRLLRIANTVPYRHGPQAVTTVTRAIMLLGFDQVRTVALSLVLLEGLIGDRIDDLRADFQQTLLAGTLARELLAGYPAHEAEEASIAAMFRSVGRLLVAVFAPAVLAEIRALAADAQLAEGAAARRLLGRSYDELTEQVLRDWSVPDRILSAVQPLPPRLLPPTVATERIRAAAQMAEAVAAALVEGSDAAAGVDDVLARFQPVIALDRAQLMPMLERSSARTRDFEIAFGMTPAACPVARLREAVPEEAELPADPVEVSAQRDAVGRPVNATEVLVAGLTEATECLARGSRADVSAVVQVVLEAMYSGLGFARVSLVLREPASGLYRSRAGFGEPKAQFSFSTHGTPNLFSAVLTHGKDLYIADAGAPKVRANLPEWFTRDFAQAASFLLMPVVVSAGPQGERVIGFFYADRAMTDAAGLSAAELSLLRSLRSQVVMALKAR